MFLSPKCFCNLSYPGRLSFTPPPRGWDDLALTPSSASAVDDPPWGTAGHFMALRRSFYENPFSNLRKSTEKSQINHSHHQTGHPLHHQYPHHRHHPLPLHHSNHPHSFHPHHHPRISQHDPRRRSSLPEPVFQLLPVPLEVPAYSIVIKRPHSTIIL